MVPMDLSLFQITNTSIEVVLFWMYLVQTIKYQNIQELQNTIHMNSQQLIAKLTRVVMSFLMKKVMMTRIQQRTFKNLWEVSRLPYLSTIMCHKGRSMSYWWNDTKLWCRGVVHTISDAEVLMVQYGIQLPASSLEAQRHPWWTHIMFAVCFGTQHAVVMKL